MEITVVIVVFLGGWFMILSRGLKKKGGAGEGGCRLENYSTPFVLNQLFSFKSRKNRVWSSSFGC